MAHEIQRSGVVDTAGNRHPGLHALIHGIFQNAGNRVAVRIHAHIVIVGLDTGGDSRSARAGVGDEPVDGIGAGQAGHGEVVQIEVASVEHPAAADLRQAHAVAYHYYYVLDGVVFRDWFNRNSLVGIRHGVLLVVGELVVGIF